MYSDSRTPSPVVVATQSDQTPHLKRPEGREQSLRLRPQHLLRHRRTRLRPLSTGFSTRGPAQPRQPSNYLPM